LASDKGIEKKDYRHLYTVMTIQNLLFLFNLIKTV